MSDASEMQVISLGGSMIVPDEVDIHFLKNFYLTIDSYLSEDDARKIIIVCGGGAPARRYQKAYRDVAAKAQIDSEDWIGIAATRLNAELLKQIFSDHCLHPIVTNPTEVNVFPGRVLIASGWKPGFSTDYDAVILAEKFSAGSVVNLSNIAQVFTDDPKANPEARPIDRISWSGFREIVGETWIPGKNVPFDPIAARRASEIALKVIFALGSDIPNLKNILAGREFKGTIIGPE
jgi:uridylate kinase